MQNGKSIIITAPSGAGKTTIVRSLLVKIPSLSFSVSATTREKRINEQDGRDYYFLSTTSFQKRIDAGEFVEWEQVYPGRFYGTFRSEMERVWEDGKHILFDVDVKGALSLKKQFKNDALTIFIKPPSTEILIERLKKRGSETPASLETRLARINLEMTFENDFDKVIVNNDLKEAENEAFRLVTEFIAS